MIVRIRPVLSFPRRSQRRQHSERMGRAAELLAAIYLMVKGYRILARRARTPYGELDLIAVRGRRLAFIEVKYRSSLETAARSVSTAQSARMGRAAEHWAWKHPAYRTHRFGLDAVYLAPWQLPQHRIDGLQPL